MTDAELLKRYVRDSSEEAFAELVDRHAAMVRGVALRTLGGDAARADEATQAVFVILAQKARTIRTGGALGGWLFRTARRTVYTMQRSERRRRARERAAAGRLEEERSMRAAAELAFREEWESVRPYLDGALASLRPAQREAVLLSCMEGRPHAEAAALLGCSTNAVRKRVQAGLRNLRRHLARKGVRIGAAALLAGVAAEAALAAPPALLAACHAAAGGLAGGAVVGGAAAGVAKATMKAIVWWKAQTAAVVTTAVVAAGAVTAPVALELVKPPAERAVAEPAWSPAPLRERIPVGGGAPLPAGIWSHWYGQPHWYGGGREKGLKDMIRRLWPEHVGRDTPWADTAEIVLLTLEDPDSFVAAQLAKRLEAQGCTNPLVWYAASRCFSWLPMSGEFANASRLCFARAVEQFPGSGYPAFFQFDAASRFLYLVERVSYPIRSSELADREEWKLLVARARDLARTALVEALFDGSQEETDRRYWFECIPPVVETGRPNPGHAPFRVLRAAVERLRGGAALPEEIREALLAQYHLAVAGQQRFPTFFGADLWTALPPRTPDAPPGLPEAFDAEANLARAKAHAEAAWRAAPDWYLPPMLGLWAAVIGGAPYAERLPEGRLWLDRAIEVGVLRYNQVVHGSSRQRVGNPCYLFWLLLRQADGVEDQLAFALECLESDASYSLGTSVIKLISRVERLSPRAVLAHAELAEALLLDARERREREEAAGRTVRPERSEGDILYGTGRYAELLDLCEKTPSSAYRHIYPDAYSTFTGTPEEYDKLRSPELLLAECRLFLGPQGERLRALDALEAGGRVRTARAGWARIAEAADDVALRRVARLRVSMLADLIGPHEREPLRPAATAPGTAFSLLLQTGEVEAARRMVANFPDWVPRVVGSPSFPQAARSVPPPLFAAYEAGETDLVAELLARGADPDAGQVLHDGDTVLTLLLVVARGGDAEMVRLLLDAGADPNAATAWTCPLAEAWMEGHGESARLLEAAGAIIPEELRQQTLSRLLAEGHEGLEYAARILEMGFSAEDPLPDGSSPAVLAIKEQAPSPRYQVEEWRTVPGLRWIIARGADPDRPHPETHLAPIHTALLRDNMWAVRALLDYDIDLNRQAVVQETIRHDGPMKTENSFRIYRVPLPVREGWTPLALLAVVQNPDPDLFRRMLAEGADPTLLPEGYDSLAHLRREWGFWLMKHDVHLEPFETFLEVGAMIRALERGDTPAPAP